MRLKRPESKRVARRLMVFLIVLTISVGGVYALFCVLLYCFQSHMIYFPSRSVDTTPADVGLAFEEVTLASSGGARVAAWFVPSARNRGTLLFCHGNAGNISHRVEIIRVFHDLGLNVLIFDYQGYGRSTGKPTEQNTYADVLAAWEYLTEDRGIPPEKIVVLGRSLGAAIAAWLAQRRRPGALLLDSAFTSLPDVGVVHYPLFPVRLLSRFRYPTEKYVRQVRCPVLIMHAAQDRIVPFEQGRRLFELAPEPKRFLKMTGTHDDGYAASGQTFIDTVGTFLEDHLNPHQDTGVDSPR